jgi:N-acetylmuramoyl-L-alanine amidase
MSKYELGIWSQDEWRFSIYDNVKKLPRAKDVLKDNPGAEIAINLAFFALTNIPAAGVKAYDHQADVKIKGKWEYGPRGLAHGICIDKDGYVRYGNNQEDSYEFAACANVDMLDGVAKPTRGADKNGLTYYALNAAGGLIGLVVSRDNPMTRAEVNAILRGMGAVTILEYDGSWSSQCKWPGVEINPSEQRTCRTWLIGYRRTTKEEDKPMSKTVCLDPGHGPGCVNGSPDGSYKEYEFAWDMSQRVKAHLERCGVKVVMTKGENGYPTLTERADVSNKAKADLFVSFHSNAEGITGWGTARGFLIYTSSGPETAARNVAAKSIIARTQAAGVSIKGTGLLHETYTVLTKTNAPAVLIEHGFHTNKEDVALLKSDAHRATLAEATTKGVCDFLGVAWVDKPTNEGNTPGVADWASSAWAKAKDKEIMDGTRPTESVTRQELAVVMDRLSLI